MPEKPAFGGNTHYQALKAEGVRIANENDCDALRDWLEKIRSENSVLVQQSAALCHAISDISPEMFLPFQKDLTDVLKKNVHPAGPRFAYRLFAKVTIRKKYQGEILDLSFKALTDPKLPVAIKVFAMTVIANHIKQYPELSVELEAALQFGFPNGSAGYKSRAQKIADKYGMRMNENT